MNGAHGPTSELAEFTASLTLDIIPAPVRERVTDILIDTFASALAGWQTDETAKIVKVATSILGEGQSPIVGGGELSPGGATLVNGYLIAGCSACDVYEPAHCHLTPEVVPPAVAVLADRGGSGADLIVAVAAGLETAARVGLGMNYPEFRRRGWHAPGVIGTFGAAASAGRALKLSGSAQRDAFGLAGAQASGTFAQWGSAGVKFSQSRGALSGLMAAALAGEEFHAASEVLTHPDGGLFNTYSDGGDVDSMLKKLGQSWEIEKISLRRWPVAASIQPVARALFDIISRTDITPNRIESVLVRLPEPVYNMHGVMDWDSRFRAPMSTRYVSSVILHDHECWTQQFTEERVRDSAVDQFARSRVTVVADKELTATSTIVQILTTDGSELKQRHDRPLGDPSEPLSRSMILDKFRAATSDRFSARRSSELADLLDRLEEIPDIRLVLRFLQEA
jgi:2-methylcitrate dehydratase PrpD